ncbi:MAG TPA: glycosyltransferase, partial [Terriglobales bacterium]
MKQRTTTSSPGLPTWAIFIVIYAGLVALHAMLLRLPYFWDEAGYFIPAARDFFLTGDLIAHTTLSNAHPPLVMVYLTLVWKLTTYSPLVTRLAMLALTSLGLTAVYRLARHVSGESVAI